MTGECEGGYHYAVVDDSSHTGQMARTRPKPAWMTLAKVCDRPACGRTFLPKKINQRFCHEACKVQDWMDQHPRVMLPAVRLPDGRLSITVVIEDPDAARAHKRNPSLAE